MKNFFISSWMVLSFLTLSCTDSAHNGNNDNLDLSVSESDEEYQLSAIFDMKKTKRIQNYIDKQIQPNGLFTSEQDRLDVTTVLDDNTKFHIKSSPGKLKITINKEENSKTSIARVKTICGGVKEIIMDK